VLTRSDRHRLTSGPHGLRTILPQRYSASIGAFNVYSQALFQNICFNKQTEYSCDLAINGDKTKKFEVQRYFITLVQKI